MSMMKRFPVSILLFLATGFIYVLQLFPGVGVLLMIFAAPLWSIVTVNLGFLFMVYEVYTGKIALWMVIFPCLYFGIYAYFAVVSHMHLYQMQHKIEEINRSAHISFDPSVESLSIGMESTAMHNHDPFPPLDHLAESLVQDYDLPISFESNPNFKTANHLSYRLVSKNICAKVGRLDPSTISFGVLEHNVLVKNICLLRQPEDPVKPIVAVNVLPDSDIDSWWLPARIVNLSVTDRDGTVHQLQGGYAAPFSWIPMPILGCALNDAGPNWKCLAEFERSHALLAGGEMGFGGNVNEPTVAAALGLAYAPASTRIDRILKDNTAEGALKSYETKEKDDELKRFHDLITNLSLPDFRFPYLRQHPELIANDADAMVAALRQADEYTIKKNWDHQSYLDFVHPTPNLRYVLSDLIERLPDQAYRPHVQELLDIVRADRSIEYESQGSWSLRSSAPNFMIRLGDAAGPAAYDIYIDMLKGEKFNFDAKATAALSLCRSGTDASTRAKDDLIRILSTTSRNDGGNRFLHSAAYIALLRMGFKDVVANDPKTGDSWDRWYEDKFSSVTPASPKSVCTTNPH